MTYKLLHGDAIEHMRTLDANSIDFVCTDLPYGTTGQRWDVVIPFEPMWAQIARVAKPSAAVLLFGQQPFTSLLIVSNMDWYRYSWVWEKPPTMGYLNANLRPLPSTEDIALFCHTPGSTAYPNEPHMTYHPQNLVPSTRVRKNDAVYKHRGLSDTDADNARYAQRYGNYPQTVIWFKVESPGLHPAQKPVDLMTYMIKTYSNPGDTVLDFAMGSATTGVACVYTDRNFIGIENNSFYYDNSVLRMNHHSQLAAEGATYDERHRFAHEVSD